MNEQEKYNSPNSDHVIEIFKTLSTHVQVLDEASAAFGNAAIRPAIILNGGAVIAFLSLFGAIWGKSDLPPDIILVGRASCSGYLAFCRDRLPVVSVMHPKKNTPLPFAQIAGFFWNIL